MLHTADPGVRTWVVKISFVTVERRVGNESMTMVAVQGLSPSPLRNRFCMLGHKLTETKCRCTQAPPPDVYECAYLSQK